MRTRSQASAEKRNAGKTNQGDDPAREDGARGKRRRVEAVCEAPGKAIDHRHSIGTDISGATLSRTTRKSAPQKRKRGAQRSSQNGKTIPKKHRVQNLEGVDTETACFSSAGRNMSEDPFVATLACRDMNGDNKSGSLMGRRTPKTVSARKSRIERINLALPVANIATSSQEVRKQDVEDSKHEANENRVAQTQGHSIDGPVLDMKSCAQDNNVGCHQGYIRKSNKMNLEDDTEVCHQIVVVNDSIAQPELADTQCQVQIVSKATSTFTHKESDKCLQSSYCIEDDALYGGDKFCGPGPCVDRTEQNPFNFHSCSDQNNKQQKIYKKSARSLSMQRKLKKSSNKEIRSVSKQRKSEKLNDKWTRAAKLRWKQLILRMTDNKTSSNSACADDRLHASERGIAQRQDIICEEGQTMHAENETKPLRQKRKRSSGHGSLRAPRQMKVLRQSQKRCKQLQSLLRWMKTWLIQANFSQYPNDESKGDVEEAFVLTEDGRNSFAQTMVKACQQNPKLRSLFLESVRILTLNGFMHAAASALLQQEPCKEAQTVMDEWAEFKGLNSTSGSLPVNLFEAVNQLHGVGEDLSTKLNLSDGCFRLEQLHGKTWKLNLPNFAKPNAIVTNIGENIL